MPASKLHPAIHSFRTNVAQVREILEIDKLLLGIPIHLLESVQQAQDKSKTPIQNPRMRVDKALQILRTLRDHDSVAPHLQVVRNQSLVLIVSHFTSAIRAIFIDRLAAALRAEPRPKVADEAFSISASEILDLGPDQPNGLAEAIVRKKNVSFQDMKSIARAFGDMLHVTVARTEGVNDIIVSQACRHAIVHNGGVVDERLMRQIRDTDRKRLQPRLIVGQPITLTDDEVLRAATSMEEYLLVSAVELPTADLV